MNFNAHSNLEGKHAFLGASKYHWINYDEDKLVTTFNSFTAAQRGTDLHELASRLITLGVRLPKTKNSLNCYVNDAIGFKMLPEQILYYSDNCFGTADTISFRKNVLHIHDYKSGISPTSMNQLMIYTALFCLEYNIKPTTIEIELRIYQSEETLVYTPSPDDILLIMDKIILFDRKIEQIKAGG